MNKTLLSLATAGAVFAAAPALAQQTPPPAAPASPPAATTPATPAATAPAPTAAAPAPKVAIPRGVFVRGQLATQYLGRDRLIGASVYNKDGQIIGDVEDLIINKNNNQIVGVIIGTGGFFGAGEKKVGVQYGALQFTEKDGKPIIVLPAATKEVIGALHAYKRAEPKKSLYERAREKARELTDKTTESAKDAAAVARERAGPAYEKAKEAAGQAYERAKEAVKPAETTNK
jgi:sporulation protein YlmC with PRC-barrel domain